MNDRCTKVETNIRQIKIDHGTIDREIKAIKQKSNETDSNLHGIRNFMDDFKTNHEANVKDVKAMTTTVSKVANDLEDQAAELRQEIKN